MNATFINPAAVHKPPRPYSHAALIPLGNGRSRVLISGQVAIDAAGNIVGANDIRAQVPQVYANIANTLRFAGGDWSNVVFLRTFLTDPADLPLFNELRDEFFANLYQPGRYPASTLVIVKALFRPELRLEIDAEAIV